MSKKRKNHRNHVEDADIAKAAFLADYSSICQKHGIAIVMDENDEGYLHFQAAFICDPGFLDRCLEELRLTPVIYLIPEDSEDDAEEDEEAEEEEDRERGENHGR